MLEFTKSTRSVATFLVVLTLCIALLINKVPVDLFKDISLIIVGAYFAKRDSKKEA